LTISVALALSALAFAVAGCGGGDEEAGEDPGITIVTDETTTDETTDDTTTDDTTTEDTETDTGGTGDFSSADCVELVQASVAFAQAFATAGSGTLGEDASGIFDRFADQAPEEIRADIQILADAYAEYLTALADIGLEPGETPTQEQIQQIIQAFASLDQQAVADASARISAWTAQNCPGG